MMTAATLLLFVSSPAVPLVQQGWFLNIDYPSDALAAGAAGTSRYEILIGIDGKPKNCRIVQSAGHPSLDAATCKIAMRRARWKPARDDAGQPVESSFSSSFTWTITQ